MPLRTRSGSVSVNTGRLPSTDESWTTGLCLTSLKRSPSLGFRIESRALGGPLLASASSKNRRSRFVGFEMSTPQATMLPDRRTLYGLRRPSAIVWKPVTRPIA